MLGMLSQFTFNFDPGSSFVDLLLYMVIGMAVVGVLVVIAFWLKERDAVTQTEKAIKHKRCLNCHYPIAPSMEVGSEHCPECGAQIEHQLYSTPNSHDLAESLEAINLETTFPYNPPHGQEANTPTQALAKETRPRRRGARRA